MKPDKHMDIDRVGFESTSHTGSWIVSYADMMTIILTFFILLLSISTIAQTKYELLVQAFTGEKAGNLMEVKEQIDKKIEEQGLSGEITTKLDMDGLTIEFSNALLFNSGEAELKPSGLSAFEAIERYLIDKLNAEYGLVIEGYTDDVPISNSRFKSNWELSTSRAIHVMERLAGAGLERRRIAVKGYADTRPATDVDIFDASVMEGLSPEERDAARAANRRVIIRIDKLHPDLLKRLKLLPAPKPAAAASGDAAAPSIKPVEADQGGAAPSNQPFSPNPNGPAPEQ